MALLTICHGWAGPSLLDSCGRNEGITNAGEDTISTLPVASQLYDSLATNINQLETIPHPRLSSFPDPPVKQIIRAEEQMAVPVYLCHLAGEPPITPPLDQVSPNPSEKNCFVTGKKAACFFADEVCESQRDMLETIKKKKRAPGR